MLTGMCSVFNTKHKCADTVRQNLLWTSFQMILTYHMEYKFISIGEG